MSDNIYRVVEVVGTSPTSIEDAARGAVSKAAKTLRQLDWFEIVGTRAISKTGRSSTSR